VRRNGQEGYEDEPTRVIQGENRQLIALGTEERFAIPVSATQLQRIRIDGVDYLMQIAAGESLVLADNPCNGWELTSSSTDVNGAVPPSVVCAAEGAACPALYSDSPLPGLAADPLCSADERRCALMTTITVDGEPANLDGAPLSPGHTFELEPTICTFSELTTARDRVRLFPPMGGRWLISVEGGHISGRVGSAEAQ
jgi:hypothetical protein